MEYKQSDFNNCAVNVYSFKLKDELVEVCKDFHYEEFTRKLSNGLIRNKVLWYIVFAYDKNTPLLQLVDHNKIKVKAAELARFKKNKDGTWPKTVENILLCDDPIVNDMIMRYVRNHNNHDYAYYVSMQEEYYRQLRKLHAGTGGDSKKIAFAKEQLDITKARLLNNDNSLSLDEKLIDFIDEEELQLRPEQVADKIKANEQPIEAEEIQ